MTTSVARSKAEHSSVLGLTFSTNDPSTTATTVSAPLLVR